MTLPLTPHMLVGAYEFLRTTPPYRGWRLPESDGVKFAVVRHRVNAAMHQGGPECLIEVSNYFVSHTDTLIWVVGHEMIHLHQYRAKLETPNTEHNADFRRKAKTACRYHGWDERLFI